MMFSGNPDCFFYDRKYSGEDASLGPPVKAVDGAMQCQMLCQEAAEEGQCCHVSVDSGCLDIGCVRWHSVGSQANLVGMRSWVQIPAKTLSLHQRRRQDKDSIDLSRSRSKQGCLRGPWSVLLFP